jgi:MFS family permease
MMNGQLLVIASPSIRTLLNLEAGPFGWLLSSWLVSGAVGSLLAGWLADRSRTNPAAVGMVVLMVIGYALGVLEPTYVCFLTGYALVGLGISGIATLGNVAVARAFPTDGTRRALTWLQLIAAVSAMAGPVLWAWILDAIQSADYSLSSSVRATFAITGILTALLVLIPIVRPLPRRRVERVDQSTRDQATLRPKVTVALVMVLTFVVLHTGADNGMYMWLPDFVERHYQPLAFPAAWIISAFSGAYFVGRLALTTLSDRIDDLLLLSVAPAIAAVMTFFAFQTESLHALAILYVIAGLSMSVDFPSILSYVGKHFPEAAGRIMALVGAVSGVASFVIPPAMGYFGELFGSMRIGMMLPSAMLATLSVLAFAYRYRTRATRVRLVDE